MLDLCHATCNCSSSEERVLHVKLQGFLVHSNMCPTYYMSTLTYTLPRFGVLQCLISCNIVFCTTSPNKSAGGFSK